MSIYSVLLVKMHDCSGVPPAMMDYDRDPHLEEINLKGLSSEN